jgi:hypothetical protein
MLSRPRARFAEICDQPLCCVVGSPQHSRLAATGSMLAAPERGAIHRVSRASSILTRFAMMTPRLQSTLVVTGACVAPRGLTVGNDVAAVADVD